MSVRVGTVNQRGLGRMESHCLGSRGTGARMRWTETRWQAKEQAKALGQYGCTHQAHPGQCTEPTSNRTKQRHATTPPHQTTPHAMQHKTCSATPDHHTTACRAVHQGVPRACGTDLRRSPHLVDPRDCGSKGGVWNGTGGVSNRAQASVVAQASVRARGVKTQVTQTCTGCWGCLEGRGIAVDPWASVHACSRRT